jgi:myo-inositol-1-phosphate synthase
MPVGSQKATEHYAQASIDAGVSFLNCMPVFIASNPEWEAKFIEAGIPLLGDDMKSQVGASILSQMFQELLFDRGAEIDYHGQYNQGSNTDFLTMEDKQRLASKKVSKENVIRAQNDLRGVALRDGQLYAGPSVYVPRGNDEKVAFFDIRARGFGDFPIKIDVRLSVEDSPNSSGVVIDAIRYLKTAREMGIVGSLRGPSAFTQKTPAQQMTMQDAMAECELLANRQLSPITSRQTNKADALEYMKEQLSKGSTAHLDRVLAYQKLLSATAQK